MRVYKSIDELPIYNYWKILEEGSLDYLSIDVPKGMTEDKKKKILLTAWNDIEDEMINFQLKDGRYISKLKNDRIFILKKINATLSNSPSVKIQFESEQKKKENTTAPKFDFWKSLVIMGKTMGQRIDPRVTTVIEYYTILNTITHGSKSN